MADSSDQMDGGSGAEDPRSVAIHLEGIRILWSVVHVAPLWTDPRATWSSCRPGPTHMATEHFLGAHHVSLLGPVSHVVEHIWAGANFHCALVFGPLAH